MKRQYLTNLFTLLMASTTLLAQNMETQFIETSIGDIAVFRKKVEGTTPIVFLHGVYYDHNLWNYQTSRISDRTVITLDMPFHGQSKEIRQVDWTIEDCAEMLIEILDALKIERAIAIGHSWGSLTILKAAFEAPDRFQALGFCNMPFEASTKKSRRKFRMQHLALPFRKFYTRQTAKFLYGKQSLTQSPELLEYLDHSMGKLTRREIKKTDKAVIINATDSSQLIESLSIPALGLKGREDYVPEPRPLTTVLVDGGHISPLEAPFEVYEFIKDVTYLE
jgi:pimeloyl-ACP methyl ester carboxylesterase